MDEVYAWVEDQRTRNRDDFYSFLDQQRAIWTPRNVFNRCCAKWLADGNYTVWGDGYGDDYVDEYSFHNGCNGNCGREHPRVVLSFDAERKSTIATISHQLDPFQRYFQERMNEDTAWIRDRSLYELNGFLRENDTKLRAQGHFGSHLVSIENGALEASDSAQREEDERPAKRPKTTPVAADLLEKVMDIFLLEGRAQEFDLFSLYCMRQTSRLFRRIATQIATSRLKTANFHITPLVDGVEQYGDDKFDGYNSETWEINGDPAIEDGGLCRYKKCDEVLLGPLLDDDGEERLGTVTVVPTDPEKAEFKWSSPYLYVDVDEDDRGYKTDVDHYIGQVLRVYWRPDPVDGVQEKQRTDMYDTILPSLGIGVYRFYLGEAPKTGLNTVTRSGVTIEFEVLESSEQRERDEDEVQERDEDQVASEDDSVMYRTSYSGRARIIKLKVDFGVLVQQHALQLFRTVTREHQRIERERPLKAAEVAYVESIKAAAKSI